MPRVIRPFDDSLQKDRRRATRDASTDTSATDSYRQGVELTKPSDFTLGIVKISDGYNEQTGDHHVPQLVYGQERPTLRDENSYQEAAKFDPLSLFERFQFDAPKINIIDPSSGTSIGGTFVSLTGSHFFQTSAVKVAGSNVAFTLHDDGHITFTTAAHAAGAVPVVVQTPGGSDTVSYTYALTGPSITSLDVTQGDRLGGEFVPINGTGFATATSVTFNGTSAAFLIINDNLIYAFAPANANDAVVDVVVTNPGGPSTGGTGAYEYWDPQSLSLSLFLERNNYVLGNSADTANLCKWTSRASAGASGGRILKNVTSAATTPVEIDYEPNYDGADDELDANSVFVDTDVVGTTDGTICVGFNAGAIATGAAAGLAYQDPGLFYNIGGGVSFGAHFSDVGFRIAYFDGVGPFGGWNDFSTGALAANQTHVGQFKWSGGNSKLRADSGAFASNAVSPLDLSSANVGAGASALGPGFFTGRESFIITSLTEVSDADCDKILTWAKNRHGFSNDGKPEIWYATPDVISYSSGDIFTIKGRNLTGTDAVYIGFVACTTVTVVDDNTLHVAGNFGALPFGLNTISVHNASGWKSLTNGINIWQPSLLNTEVIWDAVNAVVDTGQPGEGGFPVATSIPNTGTVTDGGSRDLNLTNGTTNSGYPTYQTFSFNGKASYGNLSVAVDEVRNLKTGAFNTPITFPAAPQALRVYHVLYWPSGASNNTYFRLGAPGSSAFVAAMYGTIPTLNVNVGSTGLTINPTEDSPVATCSVYSDDATIGAAHFGSYWNKDAAGAIDITTDAPWNDMLTGAFPGEPTRYHETLIVATSASLADTYALTEEKRLMMKWSQHFYGTAAAA